jgi:hypothetical protein
VKIFGISETKIEKTFLYECGLIIAQGVLPSAALTALDNSAFSRTEKMLRIKLTENQKWILFTKIIEEMNLSIEEELENVNEYIAKEIARNVVFHFREFTDKESFKKLILPHSAVGKYVFSNPSLQRGKSIKKLISKLDEIDEIENFESLKKWALKVGKMGID